MSSTNFGSMLMFASCVFVIVVVWFVVVVVALVVALVVVCVVGVIVVVLALTCRIKSVVTEQAPVTIPPGKEQTTKSGTSI